MKLQQSKKGIYFVTISPSLIKLKAWQKGDELIIVPNKEGQLEIRKI